MALVRAQVGIQSRDNIPANFATNTLHFDTIGLSESILDNICDLIVDLYALEPDASPLQEFMSADLCGDYAQIKLYDMSDPEPRSPIRTLPFSITPDPGEGLPPEVAICLSYHAAFESGVPSARRKGRFFLPFIAQNVSTAGRPGDTAIELLGIALEEFRAAADASANVDWVVWSPTDAESHVVTGGWVDNEFDTQRRRGLKYTTRSVWGS